LSQSDTPFTLKAQRKLRAQRKHARTRATDWLFNRRLLAMTMRREHVLCIGDSHIDVFRFVHVPHVWFRARMVVGATASGLLNSGSVTRARAVILVRLASAKHWQRLLLQLGEVDCGYVIWDRAARHGLSVDEQLALTVESYRVFLEEIQAMQFRDICVLSAPLPTIDDLPNQWQGSVANKRKTVTATQSERTELTIRFNAELRRQCESLQIVFVDVTSGHRDDATGMIAPQFLKDSRRDHHLAKEPYAALISRELQRAWRAPR
jgi:hypothetical protein